MKKIGELKKEFRDKFIVHGTKSIISEALDNPEIMVEWLGEVLREDPLETLVVHEIKPSELRGNKKYKYYMECPSCKKGLVISNERLKRRIALLKEQKESIEAKNSILEVIKFLEEKTKEIKKKIN